MEVLVEWDYTYDNCLDKIHKKYGQNINVTRAKTIKTGGFFGFFQKDAVEITFALDLNKCISKHDSINHEKNNENKLNISKNIIKEKQELLDLVEKKSPEIIEKSLSYNNDLYRPDDFRQDKDIEMLRVTISELADRVSKIGPLGASNVEHPNLNKLSVILEANAFSKSYSDKIISYVRSHLSITELEEFSNVQISAMQRISESIKIKKFNYESFINNKNSAKIFTVIGPTGNGKTTTLVKLSAYYLMPIARKCQKSLKVQAVTLDKYRIGGEHQIYTYCYYMDIPLTIVGSNEELKTFLLENQNVCDVIFIDTTGRSPNDVEKIEEMQKCFTGVDSDIEFFLAISASTQACDVLQIMKQYKSFDYSSVIITKLDETSYPGGVVSVLDEEDVPISYITTGQTVPSDFEKATVGAFLTKLKGFDEADSFVAKNYFAEDNYITWR